MTTRTSAWLVLAALASSGPASAAVPHGRWTNALKPRGRLGPLLTLAADGVARYTIVLPANPTTQEQKAADDLALWLREMSDAPFRVVREGRGFRPSGREISIGRTELLRRAALPDGEADLGDEGYAIAVRGRTLFLSGGRKRGPINAVYALLEEDLGCRWYTRDSATIPHTRRLRFRPVPRRFVPILEIRDPYYWDAFDGTWSLRNRTNSPAAPVPEEWGGNVDYALFVHTFNTLVPPERYFAEHPEYFSELGGKRQPVQLCLTNPEVLRIATEKVKEVLRAHPHSEVISVSPNDTTGYCECARCKAIDDAEGSQSATLLRFVNAVAEAIAPEFPGVKVSTLAYLGTFMPPRETRPRPNVAIQLCTDSHAWSRPFLLVTETDKFQKAMKAWAAIGATIHIWDYVVNFSHYTAPMPNMPVVTPAIRFYVANNARGIMLQGAYQSPGSENGPMRCWVWAKQLWDPSRDTRALMRDFIYGYYGEAAEPLMAYNMMLWDTWEEYHRKPHTTLAENPLLCDIRYPPDNPMFGPAYLEKAGALFAEAERLARNEETRRRVKQAKLAYLYARLCQEVGFRTDGGELRPGTWKKAGGAESERETYERLVGEFEAIAAREKVTHIREGGPDLAQKIATWRELLGGRQ